MWCKVLAVPLLALAVQAQIKAPQMGAVRCADGSVRPVYGVPGALVLGKPIAISAVAASFSEAGGVIATTSAILLVDGAGKPLGQWTASDPGASVGIEADGTSAVAWLPKFSSLLTWNGSAFERTVVPVPPVGQVTSVRRDSASAYLLVADGAGSVSEYIISLTSGEILSIRYLPGITGKPLTFGSFLLFQDGAGIAIQSAAGSQSIPLSGTKLTMEKMGNEWVHVIGSNSSGSWALHLAAEDSKLFELPGVSGLQESK